MGVLKYYDTVSGTWKPVVDNNFGMTSIVGYEVPGGLLNNTNKVFTTAQPYVGGSLAVFINGLRQTQIHYAETNPSTGTFTMDEAPLDSDNIVVSYQATVSTTGNADTVDGFHASTTPTANTIPVLNSDGKLVGATTPDIVAYQTDENNTITNVLTGAMPVFQAGWGQVIGNGTVTITDTITFPKPFTKLLGIVVTQGPAKSGGYEQDLTTFPTGPDTGTTAAFGTSSNTGTSIRLSRTSTYGATSYYSYSWLAWGII